MITGSLSRRAEALLAARTPFVVATAVHARRPTSVHAGDSALVLPDGTIEGFVGGTCAQASVRLHALRSMETGEPVLLRLVPGSEADLAGAAAGGDAAVVEHNPCLSGGTLELFLEPCLPAPMLIAVGDAPIADALRAIARAAGYVVTGGGARSEARSAAAVVVASHGHDEQRLLTEALLAGVPYVALVASAKRAAAVRESLEVPDELRAQLHSPAGLALGARTPAEIAIAILAEIVSERRSVPSAQAPAESVDPICGMTVAVTASTPMLRAGGEAHWFCCDGCRDAFAAQHTGDAVSR
jgi:xanthine dehydrogenase accessory factor